MVRLRWRLDVAGLDSCGASHSVVFQLLRVLIPFLVVAPGSAALEYAEYDEERNEEHATRRQRGCWLAIASPPSVGRLPPGNLPDHPNDNTGDG